MLGCMHGLVVPSPAMIRRAWSFKQVTEMTVIPYQAGRNVRVLPLSGLPGGHGGAYGRGVPCLGGAPPRPP